jgi:hypothetical protein
MGSDQSIYIGIYLRCKKKMESYDDWIGMICENNHPTMNKIKFCPQCGKPLKDVYESKQRFKEQWYRFDLKYHNEDICDLLNQKCGESSEFQSEDILIFNVDKTPYGQYYDSNTIAIYDIVVDCTQLKARFDHEYFELMTFLRTYYESVDLQWGLIIDWN